MNTLPESSELAASKRWVIKMSPRDPAAPHRPATPLELFFDLAFVIAIAIAAGELHHGLVAGHIFESVLGYTTVFFAIWWAWMNFTWFASAYDTDDGPYRIATMVQMFGVLILAIGIHDAFAQDFTIMTIGYVVMRVAIVTQWLRAAGAHPQGRSTALTFAAGVTVLQILWIARLALPESLGLASFAILVAGELSVPFIASRRGPAIPWHPHHIAERYGLLTIIVLGELLLAATLALEAVTSESDLALQLVVLSVAAVVVVFSIWWLYFAADAGKQLKEGAAHPLIWGYGHYGIFAAIAAVGAGLQVTIEAANNHGELTDTGAMLATLVPVGIVIAMIGLLHGANMGNRIGVTTAVLVVAAAFTTPVLGLTGAMIIAAIVTAGAVAVQLRYAAVHS